MLFSGGLIPTFLVVRATGLIDNLGALIVPNLVSTWNLLIMRNFFYQIPRSLEESAEIDGAGPLRTLVTIVVPLSAPSFATIGLFYAVAHWNAWFDAAIYINSVAKLPVQNILRALVIAGTDVDSIQDIDVEQLPPAQTIPICHDHHQHAADRVRVPLHPALLRQGDTDRSRQGIGMPR